jgi:cation diffusion facilitator CzcD-associated flavoprotein CzcO
VSMLPWQCPDVITTLRHLRLNLYLPDPYNARLWEDVLAQQLANLIRAFDNGRRLRDLRVLIVTWHQFRDLSTRQAEMLGIFEQVHMRGHVQVKTRSIDGKLKAALHDLDLTNRMRDSRMSQVPIVNREDCKVVESGMDWEWEGGITI